MLSHSVGVSRPCFARLAPTRPSRLDGVKKSAGAETASTQPPGERGAAPAAPGFQNLGDTKSDTGDLPHEAAPSAAGMTRPHKGDWGKAASLSPGVPCRVTSGLKDRVASGPKLAGSGHWRTQTSLERGSSALHSDVGGFPGHWTVSGPIPGLCTRCQQRACARANTTPDCGVGSPGLRPAPEECDFRTHGLVQIKFRGKSASPG